jgi:hypothetical protein
MKKLIYFIALSFIMLPICAELKSDSISHDSISKSEMIDSTKMKNTVIPDSGKKAMVEPEKTEISNPSEESDSTGAQLDKIIRKNGTIIYATVISKNLYEVQYKLKSSKLIKKLSTANIKEIQYADGKTDLIDNRLDKKPKDWVTQKSEKDWDKVQIAYEEIAVAGMTNKGPVETVFEAKKLTADNELLERSALIVLKKKAYALGCSAILIKNKSFKREYGELPSVTVTADAYAKP